MPITVPRIFLGKIELLKKRLLKKRWAQLVTRVIHLLGHDGAGDMAASLSYYILLSVFPLLLGVIAVLGYIFPSQVVQEELFRFFETNLPTSAGLLQDNIATIIKLRGTLGILGLLGLFWSGSALFASIGRITNRAWGIERYRPFYIRKLCDFVLGLGTGIIFFISIGLAAITALLPPANFPFGVTLTAIITEMVVFTLIFVVFLLIYRYMPNTMIVWQDVWIWALLGAVMFETIRNLFTWYLERFANFQIVYGSIASVIAFLVWIYLSAFVLIVGIEFSAEYTKMKKESKLNRASGEDAASS